MVGTGVEVQPISHKRLLKSKQGVLKRGIDSECTIQRKGRAIQEVMLCWLAHGNEFLCIIFQLLFDLRRSFRFLHFERWLRYSSFFHLGWRCQCSHSEYSTRRKDCQKEEKEDSFCYGWEVMLKSNTEHFQKCRRLFIMNMRN